MKVVNGPGWHLLVQSQQRKHQNNVWNLLKVNNKDTMVTPLMTVLLYLHENIPHAFLCWWTNSLYMKFYFKNLMIL